MYRAIAAQPDVFAAYYLPMSEPETGLAQFARSVILRVYALLISAV